MQDIIQCSSLFSLFKFISINFFWFHILIFVYFILFVHRTRDHLCIPEFIIKHAPKYCKKENLTTTKITPAVVLDLLH